MGFIKKDYILGLDIGASSIKIAQFMNKEGGFSLVKADFLELKEAQGETSHDKEIVSSIKSLLKGVDIRKSKIIATIDCPMTAVKTVKTPYMPRSELRQAIMLQAKNYFPFPIQDSLLDYDILGDIVEKGVRKYQILVSVSPKKTVTRYLSLLGEAGIKPFSFVPSSYALHKLAEYYGNSKKGVSICLIDMGESHTELIICRDGELLFSRKIPVAGSDFTKAMTGALVSDRGRTELSLAEAESIKREVGIPPEGEEKVISNKISTTQVLSMMRTPLEQFTSEIERCLDYYREETAGSKVDSIILFGGGASLGGLVKFASNSLGIEVKLGDAFDGLKIEAGALPERGKVSHRTELAVGAALTAGGGINLLPPEIKEKTKRVITRGTIEAIVTAIIFILFLFYVGMRIQLGNFEKRIAVAKLEFDSLQLELKKADASQAVNMVLVDEPNWEDIFKELSNVIPSEIHLTDMQMKNRIITMKGVVSSEDAEQVLSVFILNLEKGIFKNVKLVDTKELKEKPGSEFELECWVE